MNLAKTRGGLHVNREEKLIPTTSNIGNFLWDGTYLIPWGRATQGGLVWGRAQELGRVDVRMGKGSKGKGGRSSPLV